MRRSIAERARGLVDRAIVSFLEILSRGDVCPKCEGPVAIDRPLHCPRSLNQAARRSISSLLDATDVSTVAASETVDGVAHILPVTIEG